MHIAILWILSTWGKAGTGNEVDKDAALFEMSNKHLVGKKNFLHFY